MKKLLILVLLSVTVVCVPFVPSSFAQPSEDSLIQAWETLQKSDPKVVSFEKLGDRKYKFKTEYFPFDGELKIKDVTVDDIGLGPEKDLALGTVEVELPGLPKNFTQQYGRKYSIWARNNTLYFDKKNGKWLSPREFQDFMIKKSQEWSKPRWGVSDYAIIVLVGVGLALIFRITKRSGRLTKTALQKQEEAMAQSKTAIQLSEKSVQLAEESNKLLKEILEVLRSKK